MASNTVRMSSGTAHVMKRGIKLGAKAPVGDPRKVVAQLTKGDARKLRKHLRKCGRMDLLRQTL